MPSFSGNIPSDLKVGTKFNVNLNQGTINHPNSSSKDTQLEITGDSSFKIGDKVNLERCEAQGADLEPITQPEDYLTNGEWCSNDYYCEETKLKEKVKILFENGVYTAKKMIGTQCVKKGEISFTLNYNEKFYPGSSIAAKLNSGSIKSPNQKYFNTALEIIDDNSMIIDNKVLLERCPRFTLSDAVSSDVFFTSDLVGRWFSYTKCPGENEYSQSELEFKSDDQLMKLEADVIKEGVCITNGFKLEINDLHGEIHANAPFDLKLLTPTGEPHDVKAIMMNYYYLEFPELKSYMIRASPKVVVDEKVIEKEFEYTEIKPIIKKKIVEIENTNCLDEDM